ncbi:hypothetical protein [Sphaerisporangium album]|nr:hypothetical protein [Sphaerisporangium album]
MPRPVGPALVYVSEGVGWTATVIDRADLTAMPPRDRALCRALLKHALGALDALDETRPRLVLDNYYEVPNGSSARTAEELNFLTQRR